MKRSTWTGPLSLGALVLGAVILAPLARVDAAVARGSVFEPVRDGLQKANKPWRVPRRSARKKNPVPATAASVALGKKVYARECLSCHGETGVGDGPGAKDLDVHPGDLSSAAVAEQSDGALYWKIRVGRTPMPSFSTLLTKDERWQVVNYVRTLAAGPRVVEPVRAAPPAIRKSLSEVVAAYGAVEHALAGPKPADAAKVTPALVEAIRALGKLDPCDLDKKARGAWSTAIERLGTAVAVLATAGDPPALRAAFAALSEELVALLEEFGHADAKAPRVFRCAKAPGSGGAVWLQAGDKPSCPYGDPTSHERDRASKILAGKRSKRTEKSTK